jgi:hypothetical protein
MIKYLGFLMLVLAAFIAGQLWQTHRFNQRFFITCEGRTGIYGPVWLIPEHWKPLYANEVCSQIDDWRGATAR